MGDDAEYYREAELWADPPSIFESRNPYRHDEEPIWTTKDGQCIPVTDLDSKHLYHIIKRVRSNYAMAEAADDFSTACGCGPGLPDDNSWHADAVRTPINQQIAADPLGNALIAEIEKRPGQWKSALTFPTDESLRVWATMQILEAIKDGGGGGGDMTRQEHLKWCKERQLKSTISTLRMVQMRPTATG